MANGLTTDLGSAGTGTISAGGFTPDNPTAMEQLRTGWNNFFTKLHDDQDFQQAVLQFGAQLANSPGQSFVGDVSSSFLGAQRSFQQAKQNQAAGQLAAEDRVRGEETRRAELQKTEAQTAKTEAETDAIRKGKDGSKARPTDLVRTAQAMANTGAAESVDAALVILEGKKGEVSDAEFLSEYIQRNSLIDGDDVTAKGLEALKQFRAALDGTDGQESGTDLQPVSREDILKIAPQATDEQIQQILNNPNAMAEVRQRLSAL